MIKRYYIGFNKKLFCGIILLDILKNVEREDYLQPIGYLAGRKEIAPASEKYEGPELDEEMLLISDFTDMKLNLYAAGNCKMPAVFYIFFILL